MIRMSKMLDEEKLVEIVEEVRDSLYQEYEVRSKRELDLIVKELQKAINKDYRSALENQNHAETVSKTQDYIK